MEGPLLEVALYGLAEYREGNCDSSNVVSLNEFLPSVCESCAYLGSLDRFLETTACLYPHVFVLTMWGLFSSLALGTIITLNSCAINDFVLLTSIKNNIVVVGQ